MPTFKITIAALVMMLGGQTLAEDQSLSGDQTVSYDIVNIRTNPLMVFGNFVNLELDARIGQHNSLGPALTISTVEPAFEAGLNYTYFERGTFQTGWLWTLFALAGQEVIDYRYDEMSGDGYDTDLIFKVGLTPGYMWRWETFNVSAGLGVHALHQARSDRTSIHSDLLFSIGWAR
jgi:hypothetical protein